MIVELRLIYPIMRRLDIWSNKKKKEFPRSSGTLLITKDLKALLVWTKTNSICNNVAEKESIETIFDLKQAKINSSKIFLF